jgi:8-oxo-dGTP pyrophosphatase MutT (NUDIX family)
VKIIDGALRIVLTALHSVLRASWFVRRPTTFGAHAVALRPDGKIILVKLRYAPGWRLPGGGRTGGEAPVDTALRELREEIGMIAHGEAIPLREIEESVYFRRDTALLVLVRDVRYRRPRWSLEVEEVREAALDALPAGTSANTRLWLDEVRPFL